MIVMRIEKVNDRNLVCGHIYPHSELAIGQYWAPADGSDRLHVITDINEDYVFHKDVATGTEYRKDAFGFQCRYCLVVD